MLNASFRSAPAFGIQRLVQQAGIAAIAADALDRERRLRCDGLREKRPRFRERRRASVRAATP